MRFMASIRISSEDYRSMFNDRRKDTPVRKRSIQSWHKIDGKDIFFRSEWEYKYALYLESMRRKGIVKSWEHEPMTFWFTAIKRGTCSYKPDFKVNYVDGTHVWVEVKGWMDKKSATKIKRFKKYYPKEVLCVIGKEWFEENGDTLIWR